MKKTLCFTISRLCNSSGFGSKEKSYFLSNSLSPDGKLLIFSYDGDIWKVDSNGGNASRITALEGRRDKSIVFLLTENGFCIQPNQYGNYDVYLMPAEGGTIKQLTFHTGKDEVENWDGTAKLFILLQAEIIISAVSKQL